ncbi:MAG: SDR family oxidoreductase [Hyphomicrobiales bacterium]|nr:MAG: SDR family oxidoreductase [Hyphomicrobiales bacterium]
MANDLMAGKRGLIMGVLNKNSIAWGIAQALADQGAEIALSYQGESIKKRVEPLAAEIGVTTLVDCDVTDNAALDETFRILKDKWGTMDFVVHAIAYSNKDELEGRYIETTAENFALTMNISVFSFTAVAKRAEAMMNPGGSLLTLSYYGADKYVPNYNVMGVAKAALEASVRYLAHDLGPQNVRVNAISAGAIKTLAASGISGLRTMLSYQQKASPLKRNVTQDEVGTAALFLLSDLASGVTGQIQYVDCGFSTIGMFIDEPTEPTPAT